MQCHAIILDTTGATYARQQPTHVEREKNERQRKRRNKRKDREKAKAKKKRTLRKKRNIILQTRYFGVYITGNKYPEKYYG